LDEYIGAVIVVSHDAQLLSRLCANEARSEVWVVQDGAVRKYNGDFEDYRSELIKDIAKELGDDW
jgi:ATP-binding cassette, subfamily F, member 1